MWNDFCSQMSVKRLNIFLSFFFCYSYRFRGVSRVESVEWRLICGRFALRLKRNFSVIEESYTVSFHSSCLLRQRLKIFPYLQCSDTERESNKALKLDNHEFSLSYSPEHFMTHWNSFDRNIISIERVSQDTREDISAFIKIALCFVKL